jgi:FMN-dependent NADH-azoreductase
MVIIISRGGQYSSHPQMNHQEPYLRTIFNFIGIQDIEFIVTEPMDTLEEIKKKKLEEAKKRCQEISL